MGQGAGGGTRLFSGSELLGASSRRTAPSGKPTFRRALGFPRADNIHVKKD